MENRARERDKEIEKEVRNEEEGMSEVDRKKMAGPVTKIYAVSTGRCVGIFKSVVRMQSAVLGYPMEQHRKFNSEAEAESYLKTQGIMNPVRYWKSKYASGSLARDPEAIVGRDVWFPVGYETSCLATTHGVVIAPTFEEDQCRWKIQMDHGGTDRMSEWPLLCGLALAELKQEEAQVKENQDRFFAVRGTDDNDGVVNSGTVALARLSGPNAEIEEFGSREEAESWIEELKDSNARDTMFYGIRGSKHDGVVTEMAAVFPRLVGPDAEYESFDTRAEAEEWVAAKQFFAVKFIDGRVKVISIARIMQATRGQKGVQVIGPVPKASAERKVLEWKRESDVEKFDGPRCPKAGRARRNFVIDLSSEDGCIARMKDGTKCGRTSNLVNSLLGPLAVVW